MSNITRDVRFKIAFGAARAGLLHEAAEGLSWQEFESFTEECLKLAGFDTFKGIIVRGKGRKWQVDIVAKKGQLLLAFDCKHWASPYYRARFRKAAQHQRDAVVSLMHDVNTRKRFHDDKLWVLPVILTLLEPRTKLEEGAVLVSLQKLPDFLNGVTQYSDDLPFLFSDDYKESPIS
ncbi:MAG TPA: restriction endonuclease [Candidatus Bathyarchaeia archaeon]|nr:restriction endonuclease [Candidatus Bathyarchaeia archaeon]